MDEQKRRLRKPEGRAGAGHRSEALEHIPLGLQAPRPDPHGPPTEPDDVDDALAVLGSARALLDATNCCPLFSRYRTTACVRMVAKSGGMRSP